MLPTISAARCSFDLLRYQRTLLRKHSEQGACPREPNRHLAVRGCARLIQGVRQQACTYPIRALLLPGCQVDGGCPFHSTTSIDLNQDLLFTNLTTKTRQVYSHVHHKLF